MAAPHRIIIGNITGGTHRAEFTISLMRTMLDPGLQARVEVPTVLIQPCGPYLDDGRNFVVQKAMGLDTEWDALLFIDSDMQWEPDDVARLVEWSCADPVNRPIVGGLYAGAHDGRFFVVAYHLREGKHGPQTYMNLTGEDIKSRRPRRVDALGTGFMLIQRHVLEKMPEVWNPPQPWFAETIVAGEKEGANGVHLGEDLTFCARAQYMGYKLWLHQGIRLKHYKTLGIGDWNV